MDCRQCYYFYPVRNATEFFCLDSERKVFPFTATCQQFVEREESVLYEIKYDTIYAAFDGTFYNLRCPFCGEELQFHSCDTFPMKFYCYVDTKDRSHRMHAPFRNEHLEYFCTVNSFSIDIPSPLSILAERFKRLE